MTNEELYRQVCAGDMDAFHTLYGRLENLIRAIARDTARQFGYTDSIPAVLLEDLQAEGTLELCERLRSGSYDEEQGKLTTWLYPFLRGRMYRFLETNLGVMALNKGEMEKVRQAQRLYHTADRSAAEIATEMEISETEAARLIGYNTHFLSVSDLQRENEGGDPLERLLSYRQGRAWLAGDALPGRSHKGEKGGFEVSVAAVFWQQSAPMAGGIPAGEQGRPRMKTNCGAVT